MPSVAEDLGGGGGEVVEVEGEFGVLGEMLSGGVRKPHQALKVNKRARMLTKTLGRAIRQALHTVQIELMLTLTETLSRRVGETC